MEIRIACLALLLSFTTATIALPVAVKAEEQPGGRQGVSDEASRVVRERVRGMRSDTRRHAAQPPVLGVQVKTVRGALVMELVPGSPADKAGVLVGDIISDVNSTAIVSAEELKQVISRAGAQPVTISLIRQGKPMTLRAEFSRPAGRGAAAVRPPAVADDINPAMTSDDPTFGYTRDNPVKLGGDTLQQGIAASYVYLRLLRDKHRQPFQYSRVGSVGPNADGHITDLYKLKDSEGTVFEIYIDAYHPEKNALDCKAPKGMLIAQ